MTAPPPRRRILVAAIERLVAADAGVTIDDLRSARRDQAIFWGRATIAYLAVRLTPTSYSAIGRRLGGRDHSTIMSAVDRARRRRLEDPDYAARLRRLARLLLGDPAPSSDRQPAFFHGPLFDLQGEGRAYA